MWMVWDKEDGLICTGDYDFCLKEYKEQVAEVKEYLFSCDEMGDELGSQVILAKVKIHSGLLENKQGYAWFDWEKH